MPRRAIITKAKIFKRRAVAWEWHYRNRQTVRTASANMDTTKVAQILSRTIPPPVMRIDGTLTEGIATLKGVQRAIEELRLNHTQRDLLCSWYWSQAGWDDFVNQFQSLPEPTEDYYLTYEPESDAILIVPISQREPNANKGTKKVHLRSSALVVPFEG